MADLDFAFDPFAIEDRPDFGLFPVGDYIGMVEESDYLATKNGKGKYIKLVFTILEGQYAGRKYFDNLNVQHENKQAMDIANHSLKELLVACGLGDKPFTKTELLHNIPVKLRITMSKRKDTGEDQNNVRYKPVNEAAVKPAAVAQTAGQQQAAVAAAAQSAASGPKPKPWERK